MNNTSFPSASSNLSWLTDVNAIDDLHHSALTVWAGIELAVNLVGALLNSVLLAATLTYRPLRTSSSCVLLAHCIINDMIMNFISNPGSVLASYIGAVSISQPFCRGWGPFRFVTLYANNWVHTVLAINRFVAVVLPNRYKHIITKKMLVSGVVFPWVISVMLISFPMAQFRMSFESWRAWAGGCIIAQADRSRTAILPIFGALLPCGVIGVSYLLVLVTAKKALRTRVGVEQPLEMRNMLNRYETSKILFLCFIWYVISYFVGSVFADLVAAQPTRITPLINLTFKGVQVAGSSVNPVCRLDRQTGTQASTQTCSYIRGQTDRHAGARLDGYSSFAVIQMNRP